ncbi:formimidoylglutamase [Aquiflexum gelatinilyticum]|uniref:Formimidoylglutamase n=1 Tax=Aquiflexum gelatinilyticum TaxID=2961943 RepID=A0A9X2SYH2_9BACT|nr:formimidoylglutamase [Aquiflexum gelatinilyticum]MCR9015139.1 formimidoylglutamase [Aquiflexum gelatinilyticum]MCS4433924.1 formimidoylglutamase [Aquiflexum gelatinilyticum]
MNIRQYFDPIPEFITTQKYSSNSFFNFIHFHGETFPDLKGLQIAIIGLVENRGIPKGESIERSASEVRDKLFHLKKGHGLYKIADLGDLKMGQTREESIQIMAVVGEYLIKKQILPVFIGGTHDLDMGQYLSYQNLEKLVSMVTVDAKVDMEEEGMPSDNHSQEIILHQPNFLFNYSHIGYQSFLVDKDLTGVMEKLYFDHIRLGHLRSNFKEIEPIIRNSDLLSFDVCAIQSSDAPGAADAQPFGISGEEACQICKFAGMNEKLSSFGVFGYQPYYDDNRNKTASVIATMVWYFIEGFYDRKDTLSFKGNDYVKYTVSLDLKPSTLVFYKSKRSEKWWMEIPHQDQDKFDRNTIIPCSYQDYQLAQSGEIPERWINAQLKLL